MLQGRSVSSRMVSICVHEATDDEARKYLRLNKGVHDVEEQNHAISITGGAFKYLIRYPRLDEVKLEITWRFDQYGFFPNNPSLMCVFHAILNQGKIHYLDFVRVFGNNTKADEVLETNAFLYDFMSGTVSFQNRATRYFVSEMLAKVDTKKKEEKGHAVGQEEGRRGHAISQKEGTVHEINRRRGESPGKLNPPYNLSYHLE